MISEKCGETCFPWQEDFFAWQTPGIGRIVAFLLVQAAVYWLVVTAVEMNLFRALKYAFCSGKVRPAGAATEEAALSMAAPEDDDVVAERRRIAQLDLSRPQGDDVMVVKELTKSYGELVAVDGLSFGVKRGECFGLLGVNGAVSSFLFLSFAITIECKRRSLF